MADEKKKSASEKNKEKDKESDTKKDINKKTTADAEATTSEKAEKADSSAAEDKSDEKSELDKAKEQIQGLSDKLMRKAAEFDNYKKRTAKEKEDFYKMAVCETVAPLLPVLDNLERAVDAAETAGESGSVLDGIKMVKKQFEDALSGIGIERIDAVGKEFDPEKHNAVMTGDSDEAENTVIEEFQKGYTYKDKVVRHSMVKVSN